MLRLVASFAMVIAFAIVSAGQAKPSTEDRPAGTAPPTEKAETEPLAFGPLEVLTDTQGVDFKPYLSKVLDSVRHNWYNLIPLEARPPELKQGKVTIEFAILPDGTLKAMKLSEVSGDIPMDRAAWGGITACAPFAPLPQQFHGPYLALRFHFYYNPPKGSVKASNPVQ